MKKSNSKFVIKTLEVLLKVEDPEIIKCGIESLIEWLHQEEQQVIKQKQYSDR